MPRTIDLLPHPALTAGLAPTQTFFRTHHDRVFVDGLLKLLQVRLHRHWVHGDMSDLHLQDVASLVKANMSTLLFKKKREIRVTSG